MKKIDRELHIDEVDSEGTWAISYGDMVTLLLCFFILFFTVDHKRERQKSLQEAIFQVFANASAEIQQGSKNQVHLGKQKEQGIEDSILKELHGKAHQVGNKVVIEFPEVSFFDSGSIALTKKGQAALKVFVEKYLPYTGANMLSIRAFTDERKVLRTPNRKFADNLELSTLRALSTMRKLQVLGIPLSNMRVGGFGELRSIASALDTAPTANTDLAKQKFEMARKVILVIEPGGEMDL